MTFVDEIYTRLSSWVRLAQDLVLIEMVQALIVLLHRVGFVWEDNKERQSNNYKAIFEKEGQLDETQDPVLCTAAERAHCDVFMWVSEAGAFDYTGTNAREIEARLKKDARTSR